MTLVPPQALAASPRDLLAELARHVGEPAAAAACADLLGGADPQDYRTELLYLGGRPAPGLLQGRWKPYWARVWGARGLRYVWVEEVGDAVLAGLGDDQWRVAEMCVKVAGLRDLGQAGDRVARLAGHELPRVRVAVLRALRDIGDTEHVELVERGLADPDEQVRRMAAKALPVMAERLDLPT